MAEYIERQEAIEAAKHEWAKGLEPSQYMEIIPAVDVAPVRHGKNLDADWPSLFTCSACGWSDGDTTTGDTMSYNYCPNCGAKITAL